RAGSGSDRVGKQEALWTVPTRTQSSLLLLRGDFCRDRFPEWRCLPACNSGGPGMPFAVPGDLRGPLGRVRTNLRTAETFLWPQSVVGPRSSRAYTSSVP